MMKFLTAFLAALSFSLLSTEQSFAQSYRITTPFAGFERGAAPGITEYVSGLYVYALGIVGVVALAVIIWNGVVYTLSAGLVSKKEDAKDGITQAVYGVLLLLGAYLILYTINPALVSLRAPAAGPLLNLPAVAPPARPAAPPSTFGGTSVGDTRTETGVGRVSVESRSPDFDMVTPEGREQQQQFCRACLDGGGVLCKRADDRPLGQTVQSYICLKQ